jgi:hypothetical protein
LASSGVPAPAESGTTTAPAGPTNSWPATSTPASSGVGPSVSGVFVGVASVDGFGAADVAAAVGEPGGVGPALLGTPEGAAVAEPVGPAVGLVPGDWVGVCVDDLVGCGVGLPVPLLGPLGNAVGEPLPPPPGPLGEAVAVGAAPTWTATGVERP